MASKPFMIRLDDVTRERWEGAAGSESLSSFVKRTVDSAIEEQSAPTKPPPKPSDARRSVVPAARSRQRTSPCEHRVPPGSFCKRCD